MRIKIDNYVFNKTVKTVTFSDYTTIRLDGILGIVNVTDGIEIFNFLNPLKGGLVITNAITLDYDTSSMDDSDKLLIYYDDSDIHSSTLENQDALYSLVETLQELNQRLMPLAGIVSVGGSQLRVTQLAVPSTAVTGPLTDAQNTAANLVILRNMDNWTGDKAIQSNINNIIAQ